MEIIEFNMSTECKETVSPNCWWVTNQRDRGTEDDLEQNSGWLRPDGSTVT